MKNQNPLAINFETVKNVNNAPSITVAGEYLFDADFLPGESVAISVYEGKIVIERAKDLLGN